MDNSPDSTINSRERVSIYALSAGAPVLRLWSHTVDIAVLHVWSEDLAGGGKALPGVQLGVEERVEAWSAGVALVLTLVVEDLVPTVGDLSGGVADASLEVEGVACLALGAPQFWSGVLAVGVSEALVV